jgi:hypothetical protein
MCCTEIGWHARVGSTILTYLAMSLVNAMCAHLACVVLAVCSLVIHRDFFGLLWRRLQLRVDWHTVQSLRVSACAGVHIRTYALFLHNDLAQAAFGRFTLVIHITPLS